MRELLYAGAFHLRKSRQFWISLSLMSAAGLFITLRRAAERAEWLEQGYDEVFSMDSTIFAYILLGIVLISAFIPLFFGTEYSDGAIRNKLATGHTRAAVYLSNLLLSMGTALLFCLAFFLPAFVLGKALLDPMKMSDSLFLGILAGSVPLMLTFCGIFVLFQMVCSRKAVTVTICILLGIFLLLSGLITRERITAPEYYPSYSLAVNGEWESVYEKNPHYLTGSKRTFYEVLYDLNPGGQAVQYYSREPVHPGRMPLFSLGLLTAVTAAGLVIFRRKDLK